MQCNGIICVNKPSGFTSFDVVAKLRGILKMKKLGHSGTLDPMATGVLPVFAGSATKAISIIPVGDKKYTAGFRLGLTTDTQDITGKIISESGVDVSFQKLKNAVEKMTGAIKQIPPMFSAVSVGGKRLYELARQGIEVDREARDITVYSIDILSFDEKTGQGKLSIFCSKGTYVRTIIHDIGVSLGCGAVMTSLVRTSSNGFSIEDCYTLEQLEALRDEEKLESAVIPVERLFSSLPSIILDKRKTALYKNGVKLRFDQLEGITEDKIYKVYGDGGFIGTAKADFEEKILRVDKNLY